MATYNAEFWEIQTGSGFLEAMPAQRALWYESEEDRERRYAFEEFFDEVRPVVKDMLGKQLTKRQQEVVTLYYVHGKTQEDIAAILNLSQSTVSRHLFGTVRDGKKIGGAIPKLRKVLDRDRGEEVDTALQSLRSRLAEAV